MKIASIEPLSEWAFGAISKSTSHDVELIPRACLSGIFPRQDVEALICRDRDNWDVILRVFPCLKFVFIVSVGVERLPFASLIRRNVKVATPRGINAPIMSDYAMGAILSHSTRIVENLDNQRRSIWKKFQCVDSLADRTLLIVGAGNVGRLLASKAKAFGMKCIGVKNHVRELANFDEVVSLELMCDVLPLADYIVATIPLTPSTANLFNKTTFSRMRPSSYFVNVSRGGLVCESDLIAALENGIIAGATLDVFAQEPLSRDSPLWTTRNLVVTPHSSGRLADFVDKTIPYFIANYTALVADEVLPNEVNLKEGY